MKLLRIALICLVVCQPPLSSARTHHHADRSETANFDYYLLSLSWAPNYCAEHPNDFSGECRASSHSAFVLHGLWPQANSGPPPRACGDPGTVPPQIVTHMLQYMPSRGLIQHEWAEHGTCSGLSAENYFAQVEQAYNSVHTPVQFLNLSRELEIGVKDLEASFVSANRAPQEAIRVSCHAGELVGVEICLSKDLQFQACSASARECPAGQVMMKPLE